MTGGLPLIVTRPEPGNAATVERAREMGFDARAMPLFAARALDWAAPPVEDDAQIADREQRWRGVHAASSLRSIA